MLCQVHYNTSLPSLNAISESKSLQNAICNSPPPQPVGHILNCEFLEGSGHGFLKKKNANLHAQTLKLDGSMYSAIY